MQNSPNLDLPYIAAAQAQKHVTHNEAVRTLDALVQLCIIDRDLMSAPDNPGNGDRYIVAAGATGPWSGREGQVAAFQDGAWVYHAPRQGWLAYVADEARLVAWTGAAWVAASVEAVNPVPLVGVNATADADNRLAVSSPASLFNHAGAGHQVKVNKASAADTASLLYQNGFAGRAEMGLTGDDDFHVKVSPDGASWKEAMVIDADSGQLGIGTDAPGARVHCRVEPSDAGRAFLMTGQGIAGPDDPEHGAVLVLTYNISGNRQFFLGDSETGAGIRVLGPGIDGYNYLSNDRTDMSLGTDTTSVRVRGPLHVHGQVQMHQWARVGSYSAAVLPDAATAGAGAIIYVDDEAGGATLAFCDGVDWRRATDRAVVV